MMNLVLANRIGLEKPPPIKDRSVQKEVRYRWPNEEVPYTIESVFSTEERAIIASVRIFHQRIAKLGFLSSQAIANIEENSCVKFKPATATDEDYVHIFTSNASGCSGHRYIFLQAGAEQG